MFQKLGLYVEQQDCIPFLGGNDFRPHDDCDDFTVIPENPEVTGTTITTNPEIFKESVYLMWVDKIVLIPLMTLVKN